MPTQVKSEITGRVIKVLVQQGAQVDADDSLMLVESMKMEIPLEAPRAGRVAEVRVADGDAVTEGDILVVLD